MGERNSHAQNNHRKPAEYGFGEYGFEHRTQYVFLSSPSSGESSVSSSQPIICEPKRTHAAELTELAAELSQFSLLSGPISRDIAILSVRYPDPPILLPFTSVQVASGQI